MAYNEALILYIAVIHLKKNGTVVSALGEILARAQWEPNWPHLVLIHLTEEV